MALTDVFVGHSDSVGAHAFTIVGAGALLIQRSRSCRRSASFSRRTLARPRGRGLARRIEH
jgi:hypothetical protein